jgi:hypothetical protein
MRASKSISVPGTRDSLAHGLLRACFFIGVVAILLPEGSVRPEPLHLVAIPLFVIAALASFKERPGSRHRTAFGIAMTVTVVLTAWCLLQALRIDGNPFGNAAWTSIADIVGSVPGAISIVPADTVAAMVPALLPFAVFIAALILFQSDENALALLRFMAVSGALVALYGLIQFEFFPGNLLFRKKEFYLHDLTAVLVNRNSIATYLGGALILNAGFFYDSLVTKRAAGFEALNSIFYRNSFVRISGRSLVYAVFFFFTLAALLLTRSRAGIASTFAAFAFVSIFFVFDTFARARQKGITVPKVRSRVLKIGALLATIAAVVLAFLLFGGRVIERADLQGTEDLRFCVYPSMIALLKDNWIVGTGLGTFQEAFSRYQDPACGSLELTWDRAHSFYLEGWIDLGVIFVPLFLAVVLGLFGAFITGFRKRKSLRWVSVCGLAVLVVFLLHSIVDFSIQIPGVAVSFAAIMAATVVLSMNRAMSAGKVRRPSGAF